MTKPAVVTEVLGPRWKDGQLVRGVSRSNDPGMMWPEVWDSDSGGWVPGASLRDVVSGIEVGAGWAATKGIPPVAFDDPIGKP